MIYWEMDESKRGAGEEIMGEHGKRKLQREGNKAGGRGKAKWTGEREEERGEEIGRVRENGE